MPSLRHEDSLMGTRMESETAPEVPPGAGEKTRELKKPLSQDYESLLEWMDPIIDDFETAWQSDVPPEIDRFIENVPEDHLPALLRELVLVDLEHRWKAGDRRSIEAYLREFPELVNSDEPVVQSLLDHTHELRNRYAPEAAVAATELIDPTSLRGRSVHIQCIHCSSHIQVVSEERYEVIGEIGRGGLGRVLKADDKEMNREVALKELLPMPGLSTLERQLKESRIARFMAEARITGQLEHPSIVPVYEIGQREDGGIYYTMKIVRGKTLHQRLKRKSGSKQPSTNTISSSKLRIPEDSLPLDLAGRLPLLSNFVDVCHAIAYAHSKGVIHRDIKPKNIMIGDYGETVVLDWGLAKHREQKQPGYRTMVGEVIGTPEYMPPEQARGMIEEIDERSDVFSLGAVLYEILTGQSPYQSDSKTEALVAASKAIILPVNEVEPHAPPELSAICEKALQPYPKDRYANADSLARDVQYYLSGQLEKRIRAEEREQTARRYLYVAHMNLAKQAWEVGNISRAHALLETHLPQKDHRDVRGFEWFYLWQLCHSRQKNTLRGHREPVWAVAVSPDGKSIASGSEDKTIRVWDSSTGKEITALPGHTRVITCLAFSPCGRFLASGSGDLTVRLWDLDTGSQWALFQGHKRPVSTLAYSPNGEILASGGFDRNVILWDTTDGKEITRVGDHPHRVRGSAFSPDGTTLATGGGIPDKPGDIYLWDVREIRQGKRSPTILKGHFGSVNTVAFSPDGKTLASGSWDQTVKLWDILSGREQMTFQGHSEGVVCLAFSPDGNLLASGSGERNMAGIVKVWNVSDGKERTTLKGHMDGILSLAFFPDGNRLVSASFDKTLKLWDIAVEQRLTPQLKGHTAGAWAVAFSPNGKLLASGGQDRKVRLWNSRTWEEVGSLKGHARLVTCVCFSPDSSLLVSGSADNSVRVWDVESQVEVFNLAGHVKEITCVSFSPDGKWLATGSQDNTVKIWDTETGGEIASLRGHHDVISSLDFSPNGTRLATASFDKQIKVWEINVQNQHPLEKRTLEGHHSPVLSLKYSPDGRRLATGSRDGVLKLWSTSNYEVIASHQPSKHGLMKLAYSPNGQTLAIGSYESVLHLDIQSGDVLFNLDTGRDWVQAVDFDVEGHFLAVGNSSSIAIIEMARQKILCELEGHNYSILSASYSPDGESLVTSSRDRTVKIWNPVTGEEFASLEGHKGAVYAHTFSPDGKTLVTGSSDKTIRLWNLLKGGQAEPASSLNGHTERITCLHFSPDGRQFASASSDNTIRLWDSKTHETLQVIEGHTDSVNVVRFSPDSSLLASGSGRWINRPAAAKLWDAGTGEQISVIAGHKGSLEWLDFSQNGQFIATASSDGTARIWDITNPSSPQEAVILIGHRDRVTTVAFSPDGLSIATGSADKTVKLWDIFTGQELLTLTGHHEWVNCLSFDPKGRMLASVSWDGDIKLWHAATNSQVAWSYADEAHHLAVENEPDLDSTSQAIELAELATRLAPDDDNLKQIRAVTSLRAGHASEAITRLERPGDPETETDCIYRLFLAIAYEMTGNRDQAVRCYNQVERWMMVNKTKQPLLYKLHRDVEEKLGI
ncbi:MAG: protein kinase [Planctomycetota bacterium]|nr:protein kinase [Planctomycetota bacterium]